MLMETTKQAELEAGRFIHRGMKYLRASFPERTRDYDDDSLKNTLIDQCRYALENGFETERDVMSLVDLQWRLPEDFRTNEKTAWVHEILSDPDMDVSLKIEALQSAFAMFLALAEETEE
jgi:hypothetical protein